MMQVKQWKGCRMSRQTLYDYRKISLPPHSPILTPLHLRHSSFSNPSAALPTSQLILQPFRCFTCVIGTSPKLLLQTFRRFIYIKISFYNPSVASPTSQVLHLRHRYFTYVTDTSHTSQILHLRHMHFTYVTAHCPTLPPLYLRRSSFHSPSVASPTSYALHLHHSSFSNPFFASATSQVILQPFRCFTYDTGTSRTSSGEPPMHRMKKQSVVDQLVTASF